MGIAYYLIKRLFGNDQLLAGIVFVIFSYCAFLIPHKDFNIYTSLIFAAAYYMGIMLVSDYITIQLGHFSVIRSIYHSAKEKMNFTLLCLIAGALFSLIVADLGGLWYFPYWSTTDYIIIGFILGGWTFYILTLIVCYEAGKLLIDRIFPEKKAVITYFTYERFLFPILFVLGVIGVGILVVAAFQHTSAFMQFRYTINTAKPAYLSWQYWVVEFFASVFICEFIEYKRKRSSLIKDLVHGYYSPLLAALSVGLLMAVTDETQNLAAYVWKYTNYPLPHVTLFSIPIFIILTWPLQFVAQKD